MPWPGHLSCGIHSARFEHALSTGYAGAVALVAGDPSASGVEPQEPQEALRNLQAAVGPIEFAQIGFVANLTCLYPTYSRGNAYLAANDGKSAAAEFQKIMDHGGIVWNFWTGALAGYKDHA
jgi:hypothetical protein